MLRAALLVESFITAFLSQLLDIDDTDKSKSLGKNGISFYYKVNLLIDIGALDAKTQTKYQKFMEVRNTFMHDLRAKTYTECVAQVDGLENWLKKNYLEMINPDVEISKEEQLQNYVAQLSDDVIKITLQLTEKLTDKFKKNLENEQYKKSFDAFNETMKEIREFLNSYIQKYLDADELIKPKHLANLGDTISKIFYQGVSKKIWGTKNPPKTEEAFAPTKRARG